MKQLLLLLCVFTVQADVELLIVGDKDSPVKFVVLPFTYHGSDASPAVVVENNLIQALSSTGLFSMPFRYKAPQNSNHMLGWQLAGIRYVIFGDVYEVHHSLSLKLTIYDTLGLSPVISTAVLNPSQIELSSQLFADQVYRSLFYATFTNDSGKQYLNNENPVLTQYLNQLVMTFKSQWQNTTAKEACEVQLQQLPGGVIFKRQLSKDCLQNNHMRTEMNQLFDSIQVLPYDNYQRVFSKNVTLQFIPINAN